MCVRVVFAHIRIDPIADVCAQLCRVVRVRLRRDIFVTRATEQIEQRAHVAQRITGGPVLLQWQVVEVLPNEDDLLGARQHAQLAAASELERELPKDLVAESMKGLDRCVIETERSVQVDALLHLRRGPLGEGDGEDLVRLRLLRGDEMDDACREHVRLPCSRTRDDEERSDAMLDSAALLVGESREDVRARLAAEPELELLGHAASRRAVEGFPSAAGSVPANRPFVLL